MKAEAALEKIERKRQAKLSKLKKRYMDPKIK